MLTNVLLFKKIFLKTWILKNLVWTARARVDQGLDHPVSHQKMKKTQYANEHSPRTHVFRKKPPKVQPKGTFSPRNAFFFGTFPLGHPKCSKVLQMRAPRCPKTSKRRPTGAQRRTKVSKRRSTGAQSAPKVRAERPKGT